MRSSVNDFMLKQVSDNFSYIHKFKIYYTKDRSICFDSFPCEYICITQLDTVMPVIAVPVGGRWDKYYLLLSNVHVFVCVSV